MARLALIVALIVTAALASAGTAAAAGDKTYTGSVHGCNYTITLHTSDRTWEASTTACSSLGVDASLTGKWSGEQVLIGHVTASIAFDGGTTVVDRDLNFSLHVPIDLDEATNSATSVQQQVHDAVQGVLDTGEDTLLQIAATQAFEAATGLDPQQTLHDLTSGQSDFCDTFDGFIKTSPKTCPPSDCSEGQECDRIPAGGDMAEGDQTSGDDSRLCPFLNAAQDHFVFVCIATTLSSDVDTGDKSLVLLPGSALISTRGTPKISSDVSIISLGGIVAGGSVEFDAPYVALAAGVVEMVDGVTINADNGASIGTVDLDTVTGALPGFVQDYLGIDHGWSQSFEDATGETLPSQLPTTGSFGLPTRIAAPKIEINAPGGVKVGGSSTVTTKGFGGIGQLFNGGPAPNGETDDAGGSHGGLGGYKLFDASGQFFQIFHELGPRANVFDDPFEPTLPGDGGGGDPGSAEGLPGGGVIQIDAHDGDAVINGTLDASGYDNGVCGICGDHGGAGAGGSTLITAHRFMGTGEVNADGGNFCSACGNADGGGGGGGRIAVLSGEDKDFTGSLHAHAGYDQHFTGLSANDINQLRGTGGAGTVFTQNVVFDASGDVDHGLGTYPEGTLTIDGGRPAGVYPPPDATPLDDDWSSNQERLVVRGAATVYADHPDFATIDLSGGSRLTSDPSDPALDVHALTMSVDAASRVDANGRGYAGGDGSTGTGAASTFPGQVAATLASGGSHGGSGGNPATEGGPIPAGAHPGSTYDDPQAPALPGGGGAADTNSDTDGNAGGGVVNVNVVGTLKLDGLVAADGEDGGGPTLDDGSPFDREVAGGGAGGSVQVHAGQIGGAGRLRANGGSVCLTGGDPLLPGASECGRPTGNGGGGGGGRVALIAGAACGWTGGLGAAGGVDQAADDDDVAQTKAADGSTYFPTPTGTCPVPPQQPGQPSTQAPGPTGPGQTAHTKRAQVVVMLSEAVKAILAKGRRSLGATRFFNERITSPGAGDFTETVTTPGAHPVTVATASSTFPAAPGKRRVKVTVPKKGRRFLRRHRKPALVVHVRFHPVGDTPIAVKRTLRLK